MGAVAEGARTGASAAVTGISMLNPQRWGGVGGLSSGGRAAPQPGYGVAGDDYSGGASIFELGDDEDDPDGGTKDKRSSLRSIDTVSSLGIIDFHDEAFPPAADLDITSSSSLKTINACFDQLDFHFNLTYEFSGTVDIFKKHIQQGVHFRSTSTPSLPRHCSRDNACRPRIVKES